jgi:hypothetical protein
LDQTCVAGPAAGCHAVEAADHGDVHGRGGALEQAQVTPRASIGVRVGRKVGQRFGEAVGAGVGEPRVLFRFVAQLFLKQGEEHHRADPGVG